MRALARGQRRGADRSWRGHARPAHQGRDAHQRGRERRRATWASSWAASAACRRSSACGPTTTSSRTPSRATSSSGCSPSEDKYYLIELVNDPRGLTTFEQIDVDTTNPNDPPHYREVRTVTTNALRFSFQFAKRFGPFTGRFGIKESTGGLGLDLHLLDDRFELRQDLFGFGEQISPRWRVALAYEFIRKLWLLGGVDDILNADRRDYFVGLQLRFNDKDLKTILPFAPPVF